MRSTAIKSGREEVEAQGVEFGAEITAFAEVNEAMVGVIKVELVTRASRMGNRK